MCLLEEARELGDCLQVLTGLNQVDHAVAYLVAFVLLYVRDARRMFSRGRLERKLQLAFEQQGVVLELLINELLETGALGVRLLVRIDRWVLVALGDHQEVLGVKLLGLGRVLLFEPLQVLAELIMQNGHQLGAHVDDPLI